MADLNTEEAAKRALEDADFAQEVLEGKQDYPEVRQAIIEELAAANNQEVEGFAAVPVQRQTTALRSYIQSGPKPGGVRLANLASRNIADIGRIAAPKPW
jgi:hypothetical protein